ncbi:ribonuclease HII [Candidatus Nitrosotalea okcheonensis]|uniref:Ribonuclease HII n=1 Tax=Candidatus Nitrosotalea okcheonensis TaxID=1903276 RepID=A0A2H1FFR9_9ARCH|nr:ribonuclease HII [Candidatus Nitrosotalea okcheonensis]SMH71610.1 Ribonuclease HII [Candidatus Nitrosotalea okcheonensis]
MLVCGVDDAGRGSVLGPLVISGISIEQKNIKQLVKIGVKDSKQLSPQSREKLYGQILSIVEGYHVAKISPKTIDKSVSKNLLNKLEADYMAKVIKKLEADSSYVDSCDVNPKRFGLYISNIVKTGKIVSSHHADRKYPVVSAASIIAKVNRDRAIEKLRKSHDLGSGYPSDPKTMWFIKEWISKNGNVPEFVRKSWKPVKILLSVSS